MLYQSFPVCLSGSGIGVVQSLKITQTTNEYEKGCSSAVVGFVSRLEEQIGGVLHQDSAAPCDGVVTPAEAAVQSVFIRP